MRVPFFEAAGDKTFAFGRNWLSYAKLVSEQRIAAATASLAEALPYPDMTGRSFLDVGCGSGLFSLAAQRLGATVYSFDQDAESVRATAWLRGRFGSLDDWVIAQGSIIDPEYTRKLGQFDVVYAWGVLHHTGDLWAALDAAAGLVAPGGSLFVAVYNDQGFESRVWTRVKRSYNNAGAVNQRLLIAGSYCYLHRHAALRTAARLALRRQGNAGRALRPRGMSARHDLVDWVGGYPFEVAKPERVFTAVHEHGFELRRLTTCAGGIGCNEFVFERRSAGYSTTEDGAHRDQAKGGVCAPRQQQPDTRT